ncbi:MAG: type II toxin-antitoxin system VapC family toxin [Deltaproteobacteria bacterium]|nr:type II toxin-antitoxin system VapC family toxin [Deltaproteobacteria bacterium]
MRALLDTSTFLWFVSDSEELSPNARQCIADLDNPLFLSVASLWEIAIKLSLGRLKLLQPFDQFIAQQLAQNAITMLPIQIQHLSQLIDLPFYHRDPFDRLIIGQSISEDLAVITRDAAFSRYPIQLIW